MPPGRRSRASGASTRSSTRLSSNPQQRLSFGPNASNKVTKPGTSASQAKSSKKKQAAEEEKEESTAVDAEDTCPPDETSIDISDPQPTATEQAVPSSARQPLALKQPNTAAPDPATSATPSSSDPSSDSLALAVPPQQIRQYWLAKERSRRAPRVHQGAVTLHEKILREFDLTSTYGPCIGISREKRWRRAAGMGLGPPVEVLAVILAERSEAKGVSSDGRNGVGSGGRSGALTSSASGGRGTSGGKEDGERAYVDRLMGNLV